MKKIFSLLTVTLLWMGSLLVVNAQQQKLATIDLRKVFDKYYKTVQADVTLKERAAELQKDSKEMIDKFKKGEEEYNKLLESANDQAVSAEEREKRKKAAEAELRKLQAQEQTIKQFDNTARQNLGDQQKRMRDNILTEIRGTINEKARKAGYTMVLDTAAESINNTPIVLFQTGEADLTDAVLTEMNAKAPPAFTTSPTPEKKDEKKTK